MESKKVPYTQNREISWLRFNQRVLEEAADPSVPLLERLKFLSIFTSNLDEFFMIRAGSLYDLSLVSPTKVDAKSGMTPGEQLSSIYDESRKLYLMRDRIYKDINKTLSSLYLAEVNYKQLTKKQTKYVNQIFHDKILPLLSPQIIDAHHPFPHLMNKEQYIFCELVQGNKKRHGIIPIPSFIDRVIPIPDTNHEYILSEQLIFHNAEKVFPKSQVKFKTILRVTRNADINLNEKDIEEDEDYRQYMKKILKKRSRLSPIRLEFYRYTTPETINYLCEHLKLSPQQVFVSKVPLELKHLFSVVENGEREKTRPLSYPPFSPQTTTQLDPDRPVIPQIFDHDVLLFYPYQDIEMFLKLLREAARDPNVVSIKITIYRLASNSRIVDYLVRAAENGKQVLALMELRARFDEVNNIEMAERLEEAGCTVIYGFEDYKVHSKVCLITYKTRRGEIRTITQIGTGNYNEKTSRQYTDLSLITADPVIGQDAIAFFQNMQISNLAGTYQKLLASPHMLKEKVTQKIDEQIELAKAGKPCRIWLKMNSLTDLDLIMKLSEASQAGVPIVMVIRGICCLLPGLKGYTENIQIFSIVGRFLEHSRIYIFGTGPNTQIYISSADFMTRNTERRVEIGTPIENPNLKKRILTYFETLLKDNTKRRRLLSDGRYLPIADSEEAAPLNSQDACIEAAVQDTFVSHPEDSKFTERIRRFFKDRRQL